MQFQVPQFIETEDTVVGPFTIRQFIYVSIAGAISFILYFTVQTWIWILLSVLFLGTSFALAFIKVEGRDLVHVGLAAFGFYWKPQIYVWQPDHPEIGKNKSSMQEAAPGVPLESVVSGTALRGVWQNLQTGAKVSNQQFFGRMDEKHYQIYQRLSGDREAARRIDYR